MIRKAAALFGLVLFSAIAVSAQELDRNKTRELVERKKFIFKAQSASPLGGMNRQLTTDYDVTLKGDSLISYLPYFGRAYSAPVPGQNGLTFISSEYSYAATPRKKGGWDVTIIPKDVTDVRQLYLTISEKGYATLQVSSNSRQPISFSGYITGK